MAAIGALEASHVETAAHAVLLAHCESAADASGKVCWAAAEALCAWHCHWLCHAPPAHLPVVQCCVRPTMRMQRTRAPQLAVLLAQVLHMLMMELKARPREFQLGARIVATLAGLLHHLRPCHIAAGSALLSTEVSSLSPGVFRCITLQHTRPVQNTRSSPTHTHKYNTIYCIACRIQDRVDVLSISVTCSSNDLSNCTSRFKQPGWSS